jgi:hypothetical protein
MINFQSGLRIFSTKIMSIQFKESLFAIGHNNGELFTLSRFFYMLKTGI